MPEKDSIYAELFEAHQSSLINFCIAKGVRPENVDDIVSEAFTRSMIREETFLTLTPQQQKTWLYSAVINIIKETRSKKSFLLFSEIENIESFIGNEDDLEQLRSDETFKQYLKQVYAELTSDKDRTLFTLIVNRRIDYSTLSEKFGVSSGAARVMVSRLRKKLKKIVNKILID